MRRSDGETVGYVRTEGDRFVPVNLLGVDLDEPMEDWEAEDVVLERGMPDVGRPWRLTLDGTTRDVVVTHIDPGQATFQDAATAMAVGAPAELRQVFTLDLPVGDQLSRE